LHKCDLNLLKAGSIGLRFGAMEGKAASHLPASSPRIQWKSRDRRQIAGRLLQPFLPDHRRQPHSLSTGAERLRCVSRNAQTRTKDKEE
jgi:hypothetical protein